MPITVRSSLLRNFCPRPLTFFVNRIRLPIVSVIFFFLPPEQAELPHPLKWQLFLDAVLSDDDSYLLPAKDFPLFAALNLKYHAIFTRFLQRP